LNRATSPGHVVTPVTLLLGHRGGSDLRRRRTDLGRSHLPRRSGLTGRHAQNTQAGDNQAILDGRWWTVSWIASCRRVISLVSLREADCRIRALWPLGYWNGGFVMVDVARSSHPPSSIQRALSQTERGSEVGGQSTAARPNDKLLPLPPCIASKPIHAGNQRGLCARLLVSAPRQRGDLARAQTSQHLHRSCPFSAPSTMAVF